MRRDFNALSADLPSDDEEAVSFALAAKHALARHRRASSSGDIFGPEQQLDVSRSPL